MHVEAIELTQFNICHKEFMTGLHQNSQSTVRMNGLLEFVIYSSATRLLVHGGVTAARVCGRLVEVQPAVASPENTPPAFRDSSHFLSASIIESD